VAAFETIREKAAERTEEGVDDQEDGGEQPELRLGHRNRGLERAAHRRDDDSIEIIQEGDEPQQSDDHPSPSERSRGGDHRSKSRSPHAPPIRTSESVAPSRWSRTATSERAPWWPGI